MLKKYFFTLLFLISFCPVLFSQSKEIESLFDFTSYEQALDSSQKQSLPLFILVVDERRDPWQISLFRKVYIQKILKEGFISLLLSPYSEIASQLPIKRLPTTFIVSPQGEALLSYQGLLWEEDFYQRVMPLSGAFRSYVSVESIYQASQKVDNIKIENISTEKVSVIFEEYHEPLDIPHLDKFSFKNGFFVLHENETWSLFLEGVRKDLKPSSLKVSKFILLEDEVAKITYAIPIEDHEMSYTMKEEDEIWKPFFIINQK